MLAGPSNWTAQPTDTNRGSDRSRDLREALVALARQKPPYGYRRLWALLTRRGWTCSENRVYRLYREEGLIVRRSPCSETIRDWRLQRDG